MGKKIQPKDGQVYKYSCARCKAGHSTPAAVSKCLNKNRPAPTQTQRQHPKFPQQPEQPDQHSDQLIVLPPRQFKPICKQLLHRNFARAINSRSYRPANSLVRINRLYAQHPQRRSSHRTSAHFKRILAQRAFYLNELRFAFIQFWNKNKEKINEQGKADSIFDQYFEQWGASPKFGLIPPESRTFQKFLEFLPYSKFTQLLNICKQRLKGSTKIGMLSQLKKWLKKGFTKLYIDDYVRDATDSANYHWNGRTLEQDFQFLFIQAFNDRSKVGEDIIAHFPFSMRKYVPFIDGVLIPAIKSWQQFMNYRQQVLAKATIKPKPAQLEPTRIPVRIEQEPKFSSDFKSASYQQHRFTSWKELNVPVSQLPPDRTIPIKRLNYLTSLYTRRRLVDGFAMILRRFTNFQRREVKKSSTTNSRKPKSRVVQEKKDKKASAKKQTWHQTHIQE